MWQEMHYSSNNGIRSAGVPGFAYNSVSSVNIPSSLGMDPLRLLPVRSLHTHAKPNRKKGVSSAGADALQ